MTMNPNPILESLSATFALPERRHVVSPRRGQSSLAGDLHLVPPPPALPVGLHLMGGASGSGKTVTSLGLALWYKLYDVSCSYSYVAEPRAAEQAKYLTDSGAWSTRLAGELEARREGVLVVDSLTYLITALPSVRELESTIAAVTYSGGLRPIDIAGVLTYDALAGEAKTALIGTLNTDLFPKHAELEGACEGSIVVRGPGLIALRNREGRTWSEVSVPTPIFDEARRLLSLMQLDSSKNIDEV